jgi:hypothetical protein
MGRGIGLRARYLLGAVLIAALAMSVAAIVVLGSPARVL